MCRCSCFQAENEVISSDQFQIMKRVLMVIYLLEEIEEHNVFDIGRVYQELGRAVSHHHLFLLFRCGLTLSFQKGAHVILNFDAYR